MSDQRDNLNSLDDTDKLPPDLEDVHHLLLRDGARWRVRLPDPAPHPPIERQNARVDRRVETPSIESPSGTHGSQHIQQNVRKEMFMEDTTADTSRSPIPPPPAMAGRLRGITAVGATLLIMALFAALLYTFAPGRTTVGNNGKLATHATASPSNATATSGPNDSGWPAVASLQKQPAVPVFASSSMTTVYEAAPSVLRRSDDGGNSWHNLSLPSDSGSHPADVSILVSPLDAQKVILQVTGYQAQGVMTCPTAFSPGHAGAVVSSGALPLSSNIPSSGSITCTVQYYSADGGQHWVHLHAPSGAVLGNKSADTITPDAPSAPIFAQGSRLYTYAGCGPLCMGPGLRIVTSTDGGAIWSYADDVLVNQGAHTCSFMPTVSGSTLFALTSSQGCSSESGVSTPALWSSADAGASWSQATLPPTGQTPRSLLVVSHGSGLPLLYLNLQAPPQPHMGAGPSTPADLRVSADDGQHWSAASTSGVPAADVSNLGLVGALSDGTVVEPFSGQGAGDQAWPALYGWKQGDAAWRRISKPITSNVVSLTVVPGGSAGPDQIWLVTQGAVKQSATNTFTTVYNVSVITAGN